MLGLYLEGVFRISGDRVAIAKIWNSFDTGTPLLRGSKHEVAGALKLCVDFLYTRGLSFPIAQVPTKCARVADSAFGV